MLDVYALNVFLTAAETENFSEAARQLNLTQPAVSMQIQSLEKKLDVNLFHRAGRSLSLTEQGHSLVPMAREMVHRAIWIEEEIESMKGEVVGQLKIGCSTTSGKYIWPHLVARFRERYPRVQFSIYCRSRDRLVEELADGTVQLAVFSCQPCGKDLEYHHFFTDHLSLIVPPGHPWASRGVIDPAELREVDFILQDPESGTREAMALALGEVGISLRDLQVVLELGSSEAISLAVEAGIGVAFVSYMVAMRAIGLGRLHEVHLRGLALEREALIAYSHRHPATRAQRALWDFLQEPESADFLVHFKGLTAEVA